MLKFFRKQKDSHQALRDLFVDFELPSFPEAVMRVLQMLRDPEIPVAKIGEQLQIDPGMHIRVLRTVSSAAFGLRRRVTNVNHAVSLMGRGRLEALVLTIAIPDALPTVNSGLFDYDQFWLYSARRASLARLLARQRHPATEVEAFTAALLQDMAVPILASRKGKNYIEVYDQWRSGTTQPLHHLEQQAFGYAHPLVGTIMAEEWDLPAHLIRSIGEHHIWPDNEDGEAAVRLAALLRDNQEADDADELIAACEQRYGIAPDKTRHLIDVAFEDAASYFQT